MNLPHTRMIILCTAIFLLVSCGNESNQDGQQPETPVDQRETADGETEGGTPPDREELPIYEWEYPSSRERLKNKEWMDKELDLYEKILHPHRFKATLPGGTQITSVSKYTRFLLAENGMVSFSFHPLLDALYYNEAVEKLIGWIDRLNIQLSESSRESLERKKELRKRKPRRKPMGFSNRTIMSGKMEGEKQIKVEIIFNGVKGQRKGWFFELGIFPQEELSDKIKGRKDPKYSIRVENVTKGEVDYEYFLDHYNASVIIRDKSGSKMYAKEAFISRKGGFAYVPQGTAELDMVEVPEGGTLSIQLTPKSKVPKKKRKYLPFEKTIPGKKLEVGQTIHVRLERNPEFKGSR